jgi:hypothetical protein
MNNKVLACIDQPVDTTPLVTLTGPSAPSSIKGAGFN